MNEPTSWAVGSGELVEYNSRLVLPVIRGSTVIGLADLSGETPGLFSEASLASNLPSATPIIQNLANWYEARSIYRILRDTANFEVELYERHGDLLKNLMDFVGRSSGLQYAVLRRLEADGSLRCVEPYGFDTDVVDESLSLLQLEQDYIPFSEVVKERDHWVAEDLADDFYEALRARPELWDVRSFVACPVLVGTNLWGVLSFAAAVEYEYSDLEIFSLRALANLAGAALGASQAAEDAAESHYDDGRLMQAVLSNELVVATRHELDDQLTVVSQARSTFLEALEPLVAPQRGSERLTRRNVDDMLAAARNLDTAVAEIQKVLETIRFSQSSLGEASEKVLVADVLGRALEPFRYRLNRSRVRVSRDVPSSVAIVGSADWLRVAFMQLILNSLDAFDRDIVDKSGREIVVKQERSAKETVRLRFVDNAGGIRPGTLTKLGARIEEESPSQIFERYVTSKATGTGLGLASCRGALGVMGGSIDLVDWRRGITFDIELRAWSET